MYILEPCIIKGCRQTEVFRTKNNQDYEGLWNHIVWVMIKILKCISTGNENILETIITVFKNVESWIRPFLCGSKSFLPIQSKKFLFLLTSKSCRETDFSSAGRIFWAPGLSECWVGTCGFLAQDTHSDFRNQTLVF